MAEREGFEPPRPFGLTVFKTAAFNRSATSPCFWNPRLAWVVSRSRHSLAHRQPRYGAGQNRV